MWPWERSWGRFGGGLGVGASSEQMGAEADGWGTLGRLMRRRTDGSARGARRAPLSALSGRSPGGRRRPGQRRPGCRRTGFPYHPLASAGRRRMTSCSPMRHSVKSCRSFADKVLATDRRRQDR